MAKFRLSNTENFNYLTPQEMFDDYKNKKVTNIYDHQSKMIDLYFEAEKESKDIALELPTGTGKTLIGLLIGEFFRRKNNHKVLYLCSNNQLVNQTVAYANEEYGINATAFTGKVKDYQQNDKSNYISGSTIAVASYSALFNCNPFFQDAEVLIFDDAHSGENYIASNWTVKISLESDKVLYEKILDIFQIFLEPEVYNKLINNRCEDIYWYDKIPNIRMIGHYLKIKNVINEYLLEKQDSDIRYAWSMISEHLSACNIFLSYGEIVIRPFIPPTLDFLPFKKAKRRIYMSATLGKSGELARAFGIPKIKTLPMVKDWENKTIGRRFFMFPFASFKYESLKEILLKMLAKTNRALIVVNDDRTQNDFKDFLESKTNKMIFTAKDIEHSKQEFIECDNAVAIVSNRFDGIDFPGDECRFQILFDLQMATHIQEKFLITRMGAQVLFSERINSRLVQALGRCTRGNTDYAAVCIVGEELMNTLIASNKIIQFNPELQAELQFGYKNSKDYTDIDDYLELLDMFLYNRQEWSGAEKNILSERDRIIEKSKVTDETPYTQLSHTSCLEVQAQYCMWREDYEKAFEYTNKICNVLQHESLKGYLGFWLYISAYCAYNIYEQGNLAYKRISSEQLRKASTTTLSIKWFNKLIEDRIVRKDENGLEFIIERMEQFILQNKNKKSNKMIMEELDAIINNLKGDNGTQFENAHELLGKWLGYRALNPKGDSEPDPIWILNSQYCIISEDKIYEKETKPIPTRHVREAAGHLNWVKGHYSDERIMLTEGFQGITVFITNSNVIEEASAIQGKNIYYLNRKEFLNWANKCINSIKEFVILFNVPGDIVWRDKVAKEMNENGILPQDYISMITKRTLDQLR